MVMYETYKSTKTNNKGKLLKETGPCASIFVTRKYLTNGTLCRFCLLLKLWESKVKSYGKDDLECHEIFRETGAELETFR